MSMETTNFSVFSRVWELGTVVISDLHITSAVVTLKSEQRMM